MLGYTTKTFNYIIIPKTSFEYDNALQHSEPAAIDIHNLSSDKVTGT